MTASVAINFRTMLILILIHIVSGFLRMPITTRKLSTPSLLPFSPVELATSSSRARFGPGAFNMKNRCDEYAEFIQKPRWGGPVLGEIVRYLNTLLIGTFSVFILRVMNRFRVFRKEILIRQIFNREKGRGLITVSNHQSVFDDPGVLSAFIPLWRFFFRSDRLRWVLCTEDVFFAVSKSDHTDEDVFNAIV